jgi:four helix bundle protein
MKEYDMKERLFLFAVDVLKMLSDLKGGKETEVIKYQLSKAATSAGANYEEAQAAFSRADFTNKVGISLKEIRESNYWLRIIKNLFPEINSISNLVTESEEPGKILATKKIKAQN